MKFIVTMLCASNEMHPFIYRVSHSQGEKLGAMFLCIEPDKIYFFDTPFFFIVNCAIFDKNFSIVN